MDIKQTTREITDYHFRLDGDEMAAMLADPIAWADNLRAELNIQAPLAATPPPPAAKRKGAAKTARGPKGAAKGKGAMLECFTCHAQFKSQGWLNKHRAKQHPSLTPPPEISPA